MKNLQQYEGKTVTVTSIDGSKYTGVFQFGWRAREIKTGPFPGPAQDIWSVIGKRRKNNLSERIIVKVEVN